MKTSIRLFIALGFIYIFISCLIACIPRHDITFIDDTCIIPIKNYDYHTCKPILVNIDGQFYVIPANFTTDLASIPKPFWSIIAPQYTEYVSPAVLHDYLYSCANLCTRKFADEVLYSALISQGVNRFTAAQFYLAVRLFGSHHFVEGTNACTRIRYDIVNP